METIIIPLAKNKAGNTSDPNNYRPIALVSACSKIFESVLLRIIDDYISTHDNQLALRKATQLICVFMPQNVQLNITDSTLAQYIHVI